MNIELKLNPFEKNLKTLIDQYDKTLFCCKNIEWISENNTLSWNGELLYDTTVILESEEQLPDNHLLFYDKTWNRSTYFSELFEKYTKILYDAKIQIFSAETFRDSLLYDIRTFGSSFDLPSSKYYKSKISFITCDGSKVNWPKKPFYVLYSKLIPKLVTGHKPNFIPLQFQLNHHLPSIKSIKKYLVTLLNFKKYNNSNELINKIKEIKLLLNNIHQHSPNSSESDTINSDDEYVNENENDNNNIPWEISDKPINEKIAIAYIIIGYENSKDLLQTIIDTKTSFYHSITIKPIIENNKPFKIINYKNLQLKNDNLILIAVNFRGKIKVMINNLVFNKNQSNTYIIDDNKMLFNTKQSNTYIINDKSYTETKTLMVLKILRNILYLLIFYMVINDIFLK